MWGRGTFPHKIKFAPPKLWYQPITSLTCFIFILQGEDEVMCKLLQLLDSCQGLKHGLARAKRIRMVKAEIARLKKKGSVVKGMHTFLYLKHYRSEGLLLTLLKLMRSPEIIMFVSEM